MALCLLLAGGPRPALADDAPKSRQATTLHRREVLSRANAVTVTVRAVKGGKVAHGAGVVLSSNGAIASALHVVRDARSIRVATVQGETLDATLVHADEATDLAILKVENQQPLEAAVMSHGRTTDGAEAVVIGNPFGKGQSAINAIVGGLRSVRWEGRQGNLQVVRAPMVEGHSGGGTFDARTGELLGINVCRSASRAETGYIVPTFSLLAILERKRLPIMELEDSREIYGSLGVRLRPVRLIDGEYRRGMLVTNVRSGSAAARAGWQVGDVIVGLDQYQMVDLNAVLYVLRQAPASAEGVNFIVARGDSTDRGVIDIGRGGRVTQVAQADSAGAPVEDESLLVASR